MERTTADVPADDDFSRRIAPPGEKWLRSAMASVGEGERERRWLGSVDFAIVRTLLLLAAVDGEVSADELDFFRSVMDGYRDNVNGMTRDALWRSALHGAGYLVLQARLLPREELVAEFVHEAEADFVGEVSLLSDGEREGAFDRLREIARADGELSEVESECLLALEQRIASERRRDHLRRYPHQGMI